MTFNPNQAFMAFFLLVVALFNAWFVLRSYLRAFRDKVMDKGQQQFVHDDEWNKRYKTLSYAVFTMAIFDTPWVWLCLIQCWNNMLSNNSFNQNNGDDSFACKFMGFYFGFSHVAMMGSNCLVAFYLLQIKSTKVLLSNFLSSTRGLIVLASFLLMCALLFAAMPLLQGDGYTLSSLGFCYADFTNPSQSSIVLAVVLLFVSISTALWCRIGLRAYWLYYAVFFVTWSFWIPATSYGIATGEEVPSPFLLVGAILSHANAITNAFLCGVRLFKQLDKEKAQADKIVYPYDSQL